MIVQKIRYVRTFFWQISFIVPLNDKLKPRQPLRMGRKIWNFAKKFATSATDHIRIIVALLGWY